MSLHCICVCLNCGSKIFEAFQTKRTHIKWNKIAIILIKCVVVVVVYCGLFAFTFVCNFWNIIQIPQRTNNHSHGSINKIDFQQPSNKSHAHAHVRSTPNHVPNLSILHFCAWWIFKYYYVLDWIQDSIQSKHGGQQLTWQHIISSQLWFTHIQIRMAHIRVHIRYAQFLLLQTQMPRLFVKYRWRYE